MDRLPDAPHIREAELNGYPEPEPIICPACGDEAETFYLQDGIVIGCEHCVIETEASRAYLD